MVFCFKLMRLAITSGMAGLGSFVLRFSFLTTQRRSRWRGALRLALYMRHGRSVSEAKYSRFRNRIARTSCRMLRSGYRSAKKRSIGSHATSTTKCATLRKEPGIWTAALVLAYHASTSTETIETAAKLLLDINCELLLTLSGSSTTYDPSEDYSWLEERFGQAVSAPFHSQDLVLNAVSQFRTAAEMDDRSAARMLEDHLRSRIKDALDALDFVVKNTSCPDRQSAIRSSRGIAHPRRGDAGAPAGIPSCAGAENSHTVEFLDGLVDALSQITAATDRFESFRRFAMLESRFEGVEEDVQELAVAVDNMIQVQIDIARGK
jgi:hypothetical protein